MIFIGIVDIVNGVVNSMSWYC